MRIFLVCSTAKTWMNTGYGAGLLAGEGHLLVSFVEFMKNPGQQLAVTTMQTPYQPKAGKANVKELGEAYGPLISNHVEELLDDVDRDRKDNVKMRQTPVTRVVIE